MALVAKMKVEQVTAHGTGNWVACDPDDDGAVPIEQVNMAHSWYGKTKWFEGATHARLDDTLQGGESFRLTAVSHRGDSDDPNREWADATPSGSLDLYMSNPACFGYVKPGYEYRVTIERIRGPRDGE